VLRPVNFLLVVLCCEKERMGVRGEGGSYSKERGEKGNGRGSREEKREKEVNFLLCNEKERCE
jgi:hypothetical protein